MEEQRIKISSELLLLFYAVFYERVDFHSPPFLVYNICNHSFPKTSISILIFMLQAMSVFGV